MFRREPTVPRVTTRDGTRAARMRIAEAAARRLADAHRDNPPVLKSRAIPGAFLIRCDNYPNEVHNLIKLKRGESWIDAGRVGVADKNGDETLYYAVKKDR